MAEWFSIEVLNGSTSARQWADSAIDLLVNEALGAGASDWDYYLQRWGCVLELEFPDEQTFERFRVLANVIAALDRVPDPLTGLIVHRGRGGSSGSRRPLRPLPMRGSGAAALPLPLELFADIATEKLRPAPPRSLITVG